jgi:hypothetical protein
VGLEVFDNVGELPVRMGINLGPVSLMKDLNGLDNVIGDGINVAQRIMSFAGSGDLFVSRQFYDIVSRLSDDYAAMFKAEGSRTDKHERAYDVYSVSKAVRVGRRVAGDQLKLKKKRRSGPDTTFSGMDRTPAQVFDVGTHLLVSGYSEQSVKEAVQKLVDKGGKQIGVASHVGSKWMANVSNPCHRDRSGGRSARLHPHDHRQDARGGGAEAARPDRTRRAPRPGARARRRRVDRGLRESLTRRPASCR